MAINQNDYFDCPHCGIKNVVYKVVGRNHNVLENNDTTLDYTHLLVQCTRSECEKTTYFIVNNSYFDPSQGNFDLNEIAFQYPVDGSDLSKHVPSKIRKMYKEAKDAFGFGLMDSSSMMARKTIYAICDDRGIEGNDYKEKIKNLPLKKEITDPLLNIKYIGDETVHSEGWNKQTVVKALDALGLIIELIYVSEAKIQEFAKHYNKENQSRKQKV